MKQEGLLWCGNRENCTGFPSEYVGFEFKEKKKNFRSKQKEKKKHVNKTEAMRFWLSNLLKN